MCGRCEGNPYRGVAALFNGDLQVSMGFIDREDWLVVSSNVILHTGETSLKGDINYLTRNCDAGYFGLLSRRERAELEDIGSELSRPVRDPNPNS